MKKAFPQFLLLFLLGVTMVTAQKKGHPNYSKIRTLKVNFISSELDLSAETAEAFWPVFNEFEQINRKLRAQEVYKIKNEVEQSGAIEAMDDTEALKFAHKFVEIDEKLLQNKKAYFEKLETILTPKQLLKLHIAEMEFNMKVLRRLHKQQNKKGE